MHDTDALPVCAFCGLPVDPVTCVVWPDGDVGCEACMEAAALALQRDHEKRMAWSDV